MPKKNSNLPVGFVEIANSRFHIRKDADPFAESLGKAAKGDKLPYMGVVKKGWYKVRFANVIGWISCQAGKATEVKQTFFTVKKGNWHVKSAPEAKAKSLGVVKGGDKLLDQGQTKGNYRLVVFENQNGWISTKGLEKE